MAVLLECTALKGSNKLGVVTPDEDGYYTVPVGAYDIKNSAGYHYDLNSAVKLLEPGSPLQRQIEKGVLYGELGHPKPQEFMGSDGKFNRDAFFQRLYKVEEDRCAVHFGEVWIDRNFRDHSGRTVCAVMAKVKPQGPLSQMVEQALQNPKSNCYFSVRSITMDDQLRRVKYSKAIITWDFVIEGGIEIANKYDSPALESFDAIPLTPDVLWRAIDSAAELMKEDVACAASMESAHASFEALATELNWTAETKKETPSYYSW